MPKGDKKNAKKMTRVSPLKPGLRGASRLVQSRVHAGLRAATLSPHSMVRFSVSILLALLLLTFVALWLGGHLPTLRENVENFKRDRLMAMGFTVRQIDVTGEGRLNEADVRAAVGIYEGDYFFGADLKKAQKNTESLPWVDRAVVRRLWPDRIVVQLVETTPYALYQEKGVIHLVDQSGEIVAPYDAQKTSLPADLRLFIGEKAAKNAASISMELSQESSMWDRIEILTQHNSGRWDVRLRDGVLIRLPLGAERQALRQFSELERRTDQIFAVVDLRLSDRMTLTPAAPVET